jgi:hypothetical protein
VPLPFSIAVLVALQVSPPPVLASNFAIRFNHRGCHYEYIDTFKGTYSHVGATEPIPFALHKGGQQETLFVALVAANFFDLPHMTPSAMAGDIADQYELEVRNNGVQHTVAWNVASPWFQSAEGRPLMRVAETIFEILRNHSDVARLPHRGDGCAVGPPAVR